MYKFVVIYRRVDDETAVDRFFSQVHLPLAERLPGLRHTEVSRIDRKPGGGESRFYLMYEIYFDDRLSFQRALAGEVGIRLMEALKPWGEKRLVAWFYADAFAEEAQSTTQSESSEMR